MSAIELHESKEEELESNYEIINNDSFDVSPCKEPETKKTQNQRFMKSQLHPKKNNSDIFRVTKFPFSTPKAIAKPKNFTKSIKK